MSIKKILILSLVSILFISLNGCSEIFFNIPKKIITNTSTEKEEKEYMPLEIRPITTPIPAEDTYREPFRLQLKNSRSDAIIFYTTDMKEYNIDKFTKYELPILINRDTKIRFYSKVDGFTENIKELDYKIDTTSNDSKDPYDGLSKDILKDFIFGMDISNPNPNKIEEDNTSTSQNGRETKSIVAF